MTHHNEPMLVTLKQLHEDTSEIIKDASRLNRDVIVTRRGRLIARISPLANVNNLEGELLSKLPAKDLEVLKREVDAVYTANEVLEMISEGSPINNE